MKKITLLGTCVAIMLMIFSNHLSYASTKTPSFPALPSQAQLKDRLPDGTHKIEEETPVFSGSLANQPSLKVAGSDSQSYTTGTVLVDDLEILVESATFEQGSSGLSLQKKQDTPTKSNQITNSPSYSQTKYSDLVYEAAQKYNLPTELIFAVISVESTFNPNAVSSAGATGLMQLTRDTFDWINKQTKNPNGYVYQDLFNPAINIDYGSRLLSMAINEFTHLNNAIYSYHAGWGSVKKWLKNPAHSSDGTLLSSVPSKITENYLHKVLNAMQNYK